MPRKQKKSCVPKGVVPKLHMRTKIPASTLYNIMRGVRRPSWEKAKALAFCTNQPPEFFISLKDLSLVERQKRLKDLELIPRLEYQEKLRRCKK